VARPRVLSLLASLGLGVTLPASDGAVRECAYPAACSMPVSRPRRNPLLPPPGWSPPAREVRRRLATVNKFEHLGLPQKNTAHIAFARFRTGVGGCGWFIDNRGAAYVYQRRDVPRRFDRSWQGGGLDVDLERDVIRFARPLKPTPALRELPAQLDLLVHVAHSEIVFRDTCYDCGSLYYVGYLLDTSTRRTVMLLLETDGDVNLSPEGREMAAWLHQVEAELKEANRGYDLAAPYCLPPGPRR
jgi:hypothetical protein